MMVPEDPAAILERAVAAHRSGDLDAAAHGYGRVLLQSPDDPDARHMFGLLLYNRGRVEDAIGELRRALDIRPAFPAALNNLGNILKEEDRHEEAAACYRKAAKLDKRDPSPLNNLGVVLRALGDVDGSVRALERAVRLAPKMGEAWHNLGVSCYAAGKLARAARAFELCIRYRYEGWSRGYWYAAVLAELGRRDAAIAVVEEMQRENPDRADYDHLIRAIRGDTPDRAPADYVQSHFDHFAQSFDGELRMLDYRGPALVTEAVMPHLGDRADLRVVDLGCGTGLSGEGIRDRAARLVGVDLSEGMLEQARARGIYDALVTADLITFLGDTEPDSFDLALCVDTLIYIGAVSDVFAGLARTLAPGGLAAISTERLAEGEDRGPGFALRRSGRFAHSGEYLRANAEEAGLDILELRREVTRKEMGKPVDGLIFVLRRPAVM